MDNIKRIALVAHDNRKKDLIEWVKWNDDVLLKHELISTGTTGSLVEKALKEKLENDNKDIVQVRAAGRGPAAWSHDR